MPPPRSHETIIDLKATPEEVLRALIDPEQLVKWFVAGARVDPRVGGEYVKIWAPGMESKSTISAWEPGQHFGTYTERSFAFGGQGQPVETGAVQKIAVDYFLESLDNGLTRLRVVQSGFGPDAAWDDEFNATKTGWAAYMKKLQGVLEA
ncbi:MAG: SRPBCC domain-containing protein [Acidobacteria bacterium]|nr:SRPBCC domain-containing protein [Acidobacteriota bacterium]